LKQTESLLSGLCKNKKPNFAIAKWVLLGQ